MEKELLLGFFHQVQCVKQPGQVRCYVETQELDAVQMLYRLPVYEDRSISFLPGCPAIHNELLGLAGVQDAPLCQVLDLLSIMSLIIV